MLPFLIKKSQEPAQVSNINGRYQEPIENEKDEHITAEMHVACSELLHAIDTKDIKRMAEALRLLHQLTDMEEHYEGPHLNE